MMDELTIQRYSSEFELS